MDRLYISPCLIFRWPWRVNGHEREKRKIRKGREGQGEKERKEREREWGRVG